MPDSNGSKVVLVNQSLSGDAEMATTREARPEDSKVASAQPQMSGSLA